MGSIIGGAGYGGSVWNNPAYQKTAGASGSSGANGTSGASGASMTSMCGLPSLSSEVELPSSIDNPLTPEVENGGIGNQYKDFGGGGHNITEGAIRDELERQLEAWYEKRSDLIKQEQDLENAIWNGSTTAAEIITYSKMYDAVRDELDAMKHGVGYPTEASVEAELRARYSR